MLWSAGDFKSSSLGVVLLNMGFSVLVLSSKKGEVIDPLLEGVQVRALNVVAAKTLAKLLCCVGGAEVLVKVPAPIILSRKSVSEVVGVGLKVIDVMLPSSWGQWGLIIGDRRMGKTTLAILLVVAGVVG